ncbi:MAG: MoaD/ThiS family protein, partial [Bryobacterales bacterium]|nr:MoaD/ThiS family protein [Bryobacterales bacterium]
MRVQVLFFGMLKDITGYSQQLLELEPGSLLHAVYDHYAAQFPRLRDMAGSVVLAHNRQFAGRETALHDGDEIALLPPVSGGSGGITRDSASVYTH